MAVQISGNDITVPRDGSFTRNVTIGGTLTYEDVTNIDSVGLVTARTGIEIGARPGVAASISVDGNMIVSGISTFGGDVQVPDKIIHSGDTNTAIRFPDNDTVSVETGGGEAARFDSSGRLLVGHTASVGADRQVQVVGNTADESSIEIIRHSADANAPKIDFSKSRNATKGSSTIVQDNDSLGEIHFRGDDGTDLLTPAATIVGVVDGTPGSNDMPGALLFRTTADDAAGTTERLRISKDGSIGIAGENYGTSGQVLSSQGSGSAVQWATPSTPITTSVNAGPLSGATNYDFTLPSNCYKVEFVGHNISTSGSGTPSFRGGTSGGILSSGNYTFTDSGWHSGRDQIDFADANMNAGGDTGDFIVSFYSSSSSDMWIFEGKAVRRTQGSIIHVLGMLDLGGAALTTLRFYPEGTGFDTGRIRWTGYSY